ncbi:N-acetylmuramoyl-L-alanine amidase AmiA precursor [Methyloligella halotolerans]|uniref:N-acetylmuramoyl-L-alanine amidase n=1 Tax=Methyloligella halotolerans TaxID=1177755 RepID=A0A1E2S346_9HYPH|nr:N-acetylmuramoyl-L-alanine amidase AmiA precursor [Methyloligella halotolerans]
MRLIRTRDTGGWPRAILCLLLASVLVVSTGFFPATIAHAAPTVANDARLAGDQQRTRFIADLSKKVDVHVFTLDNPYRVIVDLADVQFQMPPGIGEKPKGLIKGYRYGLFAPGKSRIVIDVASPFLVDKTFVLDARDGQPARLVIDLVPTDRKTFLKSTESAAAETSPPVRPLPPAKERPASAKPIVVLDPGHGGIDSGAVSKKGTEEKDVVMAFTQLLKKQLEETGKFDVALTREGDRFLTLRDRVAFAHEKGASLFLSIHADFFPHKGEARGATIFTLSENGSDAEARALAAKENLADAVGGYELPQEPDEILANILIDLAQRETQNRSMVFAGAILSTLEGRVKLHSSKPKSASFRVLKSPDVPSVLLELGYLSDTDDEKLLLSESWREKTAQAVSHAVESYFEQRIARTPF